MSEENVEIVRRVYEAAAASRDVPREAFAAEFEMDLRDVAPDFGLVRGSEATLQAMRDYWEMFEDFHIELKEVIYADHERVVTAVRDGGRIEGSEAQVWNDFFNVWWFSDGKIARQSAHTQRSRALEAAGLSE